MNGSDAKYYDELKREEELHEAYLEGYSDGHHDGEDCYGMFDKENAWKRSDTVKKFRKK